MDTITAVKRVPHFFALTVIALSLSALALVSCASSPDRYRGSLSDAMDKARDDNEGSRSVPDYPIRGDYPDDEPDGPYVEASGTPLFAPGEEGGLIFGVRGATVHLSSEAWDADFDGDICAGVGGDEAEFLFYAGVHVADPLPGSGADASIDGSVGFLRGGGELRWFPFPERTYFSPHLDVGMAGFTMGWTFKNPLIAGNETIESDNLGGLILSAGAGVYLARFKHFELGFRVVPEVYLYGDTTSEGFLNDFFAPYGIVKLSWEAYFR